MRAGLQRADRCLCNERKMIIRRLIAIVILAISAAFLMPAPVSAQEHDEELARQLFETGRAYFERAQYEEAVEAFAEAYRLSGRPQLLVNEARALEALGRHDEAVEALERAMVELPADSPLRPQVEQRLMRLRAQTDREGPSEDEDGADREAEADDEERPERGLMFWSGVGGVSLGGAALVVSLGTGVAGHNIAEDLAEACPGGVCLPDREDDAERGKALSATSTAMLVIGLSASVTGLVLLLLDDDEEAAPDDGGVEVTGGPGMLGAGLRLRF